ncbi:MAG: NAD(P)/FAD-dependent oxidoreductase [Desulfobulbales bacterium]|nr:NAD(P)/FAD-dependent oxidoreductase [Desulfobulbales bacterium]
MHHVVIVGGGFAGLNGAKLLGKSKSVAVTLIDRENYHLFQPLLYQVAMAALSPADIASPIRSILSEYHNVKVLLGEVVGVDPRRNRLFADIGEYNYDYLILACGVRHSYFGRENWEKWAPGLKTIEQALEIRRRVLTAFERAERDMAANQAGERLTFIIVGGGPTGVELAGAIGEMCRFTLARDFRRIDPISTRIILLEAGERILPSFSVKLAGRAARDLVNLGVEVKTSSKVTDINAEGVAIGTEKIRADTVLWAAGIRAPALARKLGGELDAQGRIIVEPDLSLHYYPNIFVAGDLAHFAHQTGEPLPGLAPVALQQGRSIAKNIMRELADQPRRNFIYRDKGQVATIGRGRAVVDIGKMKFGGFFAWLVWLIVHIYYLTGFKNRLSVTLNWGWSFLTFRRGARLIVSKEWRFYHRSGENG